MSNSQPSATGGTACASGVAEAGIDTVRVLFRVRDEREQARLASLSNGSAKLPGEYAGLRAGWMPDQELLWIEGRPAKAVGLGLGLLPPVALREAIGATLGELRDVGLDGGWREVGVSRLDATATLTVERPSEGWALLRGMAALEMPRRKAAIYLDRGRPQTVYRLTAAGNVRERIYDKGAQLGTDEPGVRIRFEAQTRWPSRARDLTNDWCAERVTEEFERRFRPMAAVAGGLRVASESVIREQLRDLVTAKAITGRQFELLAGHLAAESVGVPRARRTIFRRRSELRRLGLAQALDGIEDAVDVPLAERLEQMLSEARWDG